MKLSSMYFSACLPLEKIYTLDEGIGFLEKYKNRKNGFVKAVKDMAAALKLINGEKKRKNVIVQKLLMIYENY